MLRKCRKRHFHVPSIPENLTVTKSAYVGVRSFRMVEQKIEGSQVQISTLLL